MHDSSVFWFCLVEQVANQKFADVVLEHYQGNDIVWIQDYHLMLLPSLLKNSVPKVRKKEGLQFAIQVCVMLEERCQAGSVKTCVSTRHHQHSFSRRY